MSASDLKRAFRAVDMTVRNRKIIEGILFAHGFVGIVDYYDDLVAQYPASNNEGRAALVRFDQGTKWLPGSLGGTYYPMGIYIATDGQWWSTMREFAKIISDILAAISTADLSYSHTQGVAAITWNVSHNLGKFPSVTIVNGSSEELEGQVTHTDNNNLVIEFNNARSGVAYMN